MFSALTMCSYGFFWCFWSSGLSSGQLDLETTPDHKNKYNHIKGQVLLCFHQTPCVLVFIVFLVWRTLQRPAGSGDHSRVEKPEQPTNINKAYGVGLSSQNTWRFYMFSSVYDFSGLAESPAASWI